MHRNVIRTCAGLCEKAEQWNSWIVSAIRCDLVLVNQNCDSQERRTGVELIPRITFNLATESVVMVGAKLHIVTHDQ